jgi:Domain of unknown function (DUF4263)
LKKCKHRFPSVLDHRTLEISRSLPIEFLRDVGLPKQLYEMKRTIGLASLDALIDKFESLLNDDHPEKEWQGLFDLNPFILTMMFGYPAVLVADQAHVGGSTLAGTGGKIADFIVKNQHTHTAALVEIKTPQANLFGSSPYRKGVYGVSNELTSAVIQIRDQKYQFEKSIVLIKDNSDIRDINSYAVDCIVIIGRLPTESDKIKCFELYRSAFKDVKILTFDELLTKLKALKAYLTSEAHEEPPGNTY